MAASSPGAWQLGPDRAGRSPDVCHLLELFRAHLSNPACAPGGTDGFRLAIDDSVVTGRLSAGVDHQATDRVRLRAQYDSSFADGQVEFAASLRVTYAF